MTLEWQTHIIIHLFKLVECTTPGVNPGVNCGLTIDYDMSV